MWEKIRVFFIGSIDIKIDSLYKKLDEIQVDSKKTDSQVALTLMKHQLASITLDDVKEDVMTSEERAEYLSKVASIVFPIVEKKYKKFVRHQEHFMSFEADGDNQLFFSRGSINGLGLMYESFKKENEEFKEMSKPKEKFDPHKLIESLVIKDD